jgi:hypothetical protein
MKRPDSFAVIGLVGNINSDRPCSMRYGFFAVGSSFLGHHGR